MDIPHSQGLAGHSDADVLVHAIMDALLGATALGDIGRLFPPGDLRFKDANSLVLLTSVLDLVKDAGWTVSNLDATVIAEVPRLAGHLDQMRGVLATALQVSTSAIGVKATTTDGLGALGRGEGIAAQAVVLVEKRD